MTARPSPKRLAELRYFVQVRRGRAAALLHEHDEINKQDINELADELFAEIDGQAADHARTQKFLEEFQGTVATATIRIMEVEQLAKVAEARGYQAGLHAAATLVRERADFLRTMPGQAGASAQHILTEDRIREKAAEDLLRATTQTVVTPPNNDGGFSPTIVKNDDTRNGG